MRRIIRDLGVRLQSKRNTWDQQRLVQDPECLSTERRKPSAESRYPQSAPASQGDACRSGRSFPERSFELVTRITAVTMTTIPSSM